MWRRAYVGVTVVVLALMAMSGRSRFDGPVVLPLTATHGVHALDLVVLVVAAGGLAALATLGGAPRR